MEECNRKKVVKKKKELGLLKNYAGPGPQKGDSREKIGNDRRTLGERRRSYLLRGKRFRGVGGKHNEPTGERILSIQEPRFTEGT